MVTITTLDMQLCIESSFILAHDAIRSKVFD